MSSLINKKMVFDETDDTEDEVTIPTKITKKKIIKDTKDTKDTKIIKNTKDTKDTKNTKDIEKIPTKITKNTEQTLSLFEQLVICSSKIENDEDKQLNILKKAEEAFNIYMNKAIQDAIDTSYMTAKNTGKIFNSLIIDVDWHKKLSDTNYNVHTIMYGKKGQTWTDRTLFPSWNGIRPFEKIIQKYEKLCYIRDDSDPAKSRSPFIRIYTKIPPPRETPLWHE